MDCNWPFDDAAGERRRARLELLSLLVPSLHALQADGALDED